MIIKSLLLKLYNIVSRPTPKIFPNGLHFSRFGKDRRPFKTSSLPSLEVIIHSEIVVKALKTMFLLLRKLMMVIFSFPKQLVDIL
jgi:hypothetical protein